MKTTVSTFAFVAALVGSPAAMAVSSFVLNDNLDPGACTGGSGFGNTYTCSKQGSSADELSVKAYSTTGSGAEFAAANVGDYGSGFGVRNTVETINAPEPEHAMDNSNHVDALLFNFNSSFALKTLQLGYFSGDSDITVLAWTGLGNATTALTNSTTGSLLASGWSLVGSYSNIGTGEVTVNTGNISSSYWLVSAYNSAFGGGQGWTEGNDFVKLKVVAGNFTCVNSNEPSCSANQTPEPGSLALASIAMLGIVGTRRRWFAKRS